jgi:hypothetical protein
LPGAVLHDKAGFQFIDSPRRREAARQVTLCCVVKSEAGSPIGEPLIIFGDRKVLLAPLANWLSRRSNAVTVDFVNHLAGRAEKEKVVHYHGSVCASSAAAVDQS